jgi:tRNA(Ile)-lysidine synthase
MSTIDKVLSTIETHSMLHQGDGVVIGLSGGADSVCLTHLLSEIAKTLELRLYAVYIDHGLRPEETPDERAFCKNLCEGLGIEFSVIEVDVKAMAEADKVNIQEAARLLRYAELERTALALGYRRIAMAHNLDDQVETFFMRIIRGSGPAGLAGIPAVRGKIIRPVIGIYRDEIEQYLDANNMSFVTDSSNLKDDYLRNKLRSSLMPLLTELNPNIMDTVSRTMDILTDEERYFFITVTKALMKIITKKTDNLIELFTVPLEHMDRAIARRTIRRAIEETRGLRGIEYKHIEDILSLIKKGNAGDSLDLPHGIRVVRKYSTVLLTSEPPIALGTYTIESQGETQLDETKRIIRTTISGKMPSPLGDTKNYCILDGEKAILPITVRARKDGDHFYPSGFGKKKKLQDFFVDAKLPRHERNEVPIVTSNDEIIWVAGHRGDERFATSESTTVFLLLEII